MSVVQSAHSQLSVPLSHLVPNRSNPRKVKASREADECLLALIKAYGLLQPLVVRPLEGKPKFYEVIAGDRRLVALRKIHRGDDDPKIPCVLRNLDAVTANAVSLGENVGRAPMHPLDEAEAFAKLAKDDGKGVEAIAIEFGVRERYVRQRMKLSTLARPIKDAYRAGTIDTATAEAFAAVPDDRQLSVWKELHGNPRHAEQVRNVIANAWIDASHALFDIANLPESAVSRDLFSNQVLIERQAFLDAQAKALDIQRQTLIEEGWAEAVLGRREDVQDRLYAMDTPEREFDEQTERKLKKIAGRREKLEAAADKIDSDDQVRIDRAQVKFEELESQEMAIVKAAPEHFSEATKSVGTAFLLLDPDGQVRREYRIPRRRQTRVAGDSGAVVDSSEAPKPPTSEDLSEGQLRATFTHEALAVREALLDNPKARKRMLALILHENVRSESLAIRHEANAVSLHAGNGNGFSSPALERLQKRRAELDPFKDEHGIDECEAYAKLAKLTQPKKIDALIDVLTVECLTAHMQRRTELVHRLAVELAVDIRTYWRPDAAWLAGYQKIQLTHLLAELRGSTYSPDQDRRKKSELVEALAQLFAAAAEGALEDKKLTERLNRWLPSNLREQPASTET